MLNRLIWFLVVDIIVLICLTTLFPVLLLSSSKQLMVDIILKTKIVVTILTKTFLIHRFIWVFRICNIYKNNDITTLLSRWCFLWKSYLNFNISNLCIRTSGSHSGLCGILDSSCPLFKSWVLFNIDSILFICAIYPLKFLW